MALSGMGGLEKQKVILRKFARGHYINSAALSHPLSSHPKGYKLVVCKLSDKDEVLTDFVISGILGRQTTKHCWSWIGTQPWRHRSSVMLS